MEGKGHQSTRLAGARAGGGEMAVFWYLLCASFSGRACLIQQHCEVGAVTVFIIFIFIFYEKTDS